MKKHLEKSPHFFCLTATISALAGCTPTIQLDTPKEGITINMNVVVDHNISVKIDEKSKVTAGESSVVEANKTPAEK
ncbi:YnbE family lipoprotein [Aggregatibacter actinomycetemcomitans]|uniref:YnbE family lipoprotein n=1 Tax=Aggregatibacter actinomycetemcomitans TaxID=714 RepID=UPI00197C47C1|nr:YnbE family lipoprotein [Aggregatibacter actinomycetemcomitans]MBN6077026.1 YnbE family lipoprotein [Aggregatibacter actinomycetemcomitans]MBN6078312.1 YnbE family lipoprotein [Aggregatibacter actinomycetemcomitans]